MAPGTQKIFDLPPWGMALGVVFGLFIAGLILLPDIIADEDTGEILHAACPGREDAVDLFYAPGSGQMTVVVIPDPADRAVSFAVTGTAKDLPVPLYGPVTFGVQDGAPRIEYTYSIKEQHILVVTTQGDTAGRSTRHLISFGGSLGGSTSLIASQA